MALQLKPAEDRATVFVLVSKASLDPPLDLKKSLLEVTILYILAGDAHGQITALNWGSNQINGFNHLQHNTIACASMCVCVASDQTYLLEPVH